MDEEPALKKRKMESPGYTNLVFCVRAVLRGLIDPGRTIDDTYYEKLLTCADSFSSALAHERHVMELKPLFMEGVCQEANTQVRAAMCRVVGICARSSLALVRAHCALLIEDRIFGVVKGAGSVEPLVLCAALEVIQRTLLTQPGQEWFCSWASVDSSSLWLLNALLELFWNSSSHVVSATGGVLSALLTMEHVDRFWLDCAPRLRDRLQVIVASSSMGAKMGVIDLFESLLMSPKGSSFVQDNEMVEIVFPCLLHDKNRIISGHAVSLVPALTQLQGVAARVLDDAKVALTGDPRSFSFRISVLTLIRMCQVTANTANAANCLEARHCVETLVSQAFLEQPPFPTGEALVVSLPRTEHFQAMGPLGNPMLALAVFVLRSPTLLSKRVRSAAMAMVAHWIACADLHASAQKTLEEVVELLLSLLVRGQDCTLTLSVLTRAVHLRPARSLLIVGNGAALAEVIPRLLLDPSWEVRESVLLLLKDMYALAGDDASLRAWLEQGKPPLATRVVSRLEDEGGSGYVKAASLTCLISISQFFPAVIDAKLIAAVQTISQHASEAFTRRAAVELLVACARAGLLQDFNDISGALKCVLRDCDSEVRLRGIPLLAALCQMPAASECLQKSPCIAELLLKAARDDSRVVRHAALDALQAVQQHVRAHEEQREDVQRGQREVDDDGVDGNGSDDDGIDLALTVWSSSPVNLGALRPVLEHVRFPVLRARAEPFTTFDEFEFGVPPEHDMDCY